MYIDTCIYTYICLCIERERERDDVCFVDGLDAKGPSPERRGATSARLASVRAGVHKGGV